MAAGSSEFRDLRSISALVFVVLCLDCAESATSDRQEAIADSIYLQVEARSLGSHLRKISNEELGVTAMQGIYDELPFTTDNFDAAKQLDEIADKLQKKLLSYVALLNRSSDVVEEVYRFRQRYAFPAVNPCCLMDPSVLMMDNHFGTEITNSTTCDTAPLSLPKGVFSPGPNLTDVFRKNLESHPSIKWQYFVSTAGIHTEYPAYSTVRKWSCRHVDDLRHRDIYLATVQPHTKHVVIVIDHGNSLSPKQLVTAKAVANFVHFTFQVGLIGLSGEPRFPQSDKCLSKEMAFATFETKYHFGRFIDALQKAPHKAFEMIQKSLRPSKNTSKQAEALIVYVSRGLLSSIADARPVLETIASGHRSSGHRVVINTYAVIDDGKPIMYETSFLKDIAELNFVKYNVPGVPSPELRGAMVTINSTENLSFTMGQFYSALSFHRHPTSVHFSLPWFDNVSKDLVISISKAVVHHGVLLGVAGVDISVSDMAEDIVYFSKSQDVYSFLVEKSGVAIVHPAPGFHGRAAGPSKCVQCQPKEQLSEVVYRWTRVAGTPYVVAIVSLKPSRQQPVLRAGSTLFLSAACFLSPFEYLSQEETKSRVQGYMAYLIDTTMLIANPGLKPDVRDEVLAIARITSEWKRTFESSEFTKHVGAKVCSDLVWCDGSLPWHSVGAQNRMHCTALLTPVVAVIGMDLTLGYFYKLLTVNMDVCEMDKIACFILDDRGYLIAHPSLMEPTLRATGLEQQHITRKEPLVRFYKLNTSLEGILSNSVHGEHCAKYQITAIPGTNAFLGIVNHTCDTVRAFCPCSMVDRLCLNCHRMEQRDCECPCECPLQMNLCTGDLAHNEDRSSNCPRFARPPQLPKLESYHFDSLQQCFDSECSSRMSEKDCSGVLGCEWCSVDMDGETALKTPFCHEQPKCFGGVLGARTPYADEIIGALEEDFPYIRSTPLGPVAGGMIGAFCLIAFLVYCYKNRVTRSSSSQYGLSYPAAPLQGGQVFHDIDDSDFHTSPSPVGPHNLSLAGCTYDNRVVVSPYRVNTAYRRPPGEGTPPPPAPQPSLSSRASSPAQQQQLTQFLDPSITRIPKNPASIGRRNSFQASVEVHAAAVR
ncbi:hypothetical protein MTO96_004842 [Rhipicephalus appendiculatus]